MYYVYKHTSPNGKVYIGITCKNPSWRWNNGNGYKANVFFYEDIKKYGWDNIKHEILFDNLTKEEAEKKEIELIVLYNATDREKGYNISKGGSTSRTGVKTRQETIEKRVLALRGQKRTEEQKKRISEAHKGIKASEETRKKQSEFMKKMPLRIPKEAGERGRKNASLANCKRVAQLDENHNLVCEYNSIKEASAAMSCTDNLISRCCLNPKYKGKGFYWRYVV